MNRYIGSALLPLLTRCAALFANTEHYAQLVDSTLETIYRLSKGRSLTKAQRDAIEDCLLTICKYVLSRRVLWMTTNYLLVWTEELSSWWRKIPSVIFSQTSASVHDAAAAQAAGIRRSHAFRVLQDTSAGETWNMFTMFSCCIHTGLWRTSGICFRNLLFLVARYSDLSWVKKITFSIILQTSFYFIWACIC